MLASVTSGSTDVSGATVLPTGSAPLIMKGVSPTDVAGCSVVSAAAEVSCPSGGLLRNRSLRLDIFRENHPGLELSAVFASLVASVNPLVEVGPNWLLVSPNVGRLLQLNMSGFRTRLENLCRGVGGSSERNEWGTAFGGCLAWYALASIGSD